MTDFLNFFSGKNYMKRDASSDSAELDPPSTSMYSGLVYVTQYVVTHNLGYIPFFTVFGELYGDGIIWEAIGSRNQERTINPSDTTSYGPYLMAWADDTTLTIELGYTSNTLTGTFPVYWNIYKDYDIA